MSDDPTPEQFADLANWHPIEEHPYLNDPPKITVTDDLRTRIAAAIYKDNGFGWSKYMCEEAADAVIRELDADYILVPKGHTVVRQREAARNLTQWGLENQPDD